MCAAGSNEQKSFAVAESVFERDDTACLKNQS